MQGMVNSGWTKDYPTRRRRAGDSNTKSGSVKPFQSEENRRRLDCRTRLTRLEQEAAGKVIVDEKDAATTILVSSVKFLNQQRELAKKFANAHAELTEWITKNPEEAQRLIRAELLAETKTDMSPQLISAAWGRIVLTAVTPRAAVEKFVQNSVRAGFIKTAPDLSKLFENP